MSVPDENHSRNVSFALILISIIGIQHPNLLIMNVPDAGHSRNTSCRLN